MFKHDFKNTYVKSFNGAIIGRYLGYNTETGGHYIDTKINIDVHYANRSRIGIPFDINYKNTALEFAHSLSTDEIYAFNKERLHANGCHVIDTTSKDLYV